MIANAIEQTLYAIADHAPIESVIRTLLWHLSH